MNLVSLATVDYLAMSGRGLDDEAAGGSGRVDGGGARPIGGGDTDSMLGPDDLRETADEPVYNSRRPINKGKLIMLLTIVFVVILVRGRNNFALLHYFKLLPK